MTSAHSVHILAIFSQNVKYTFILICTGVLEMVYGFFTSRETRFRFT